MEKEYVIVVHRGIDIAEFDAEMASSQGHGPIPKRSVDIANPRPGSKRMTHWMITPQEAEELRKDPRVLAVEIPAEKRDDVKIGFNATQSGNFYRTTFNDTTYSSSYWPSYTNWGLKRSIDATNVWTTNKDYNDTYDYAITGNGVDVVIQDSGIEPNHPEWNDSNGTSRLKQINWYTASGISGTQDSNFYSDYDGHGTHVASTLAGKRYGWAKGANIYSQKLAGLEGSGDPSSGISITDAFDAIRLWHNAKGTGRPTVVNMSWGYNTTIVANAPTSGVYRGTSWTWNVDYTNFVTLGANTGVQTPYGYGSSYLWKLPVRIASVDAEIEEMIDDGIVVCIAAGNESYKIDSSTGTDYNNSVLISGVTCDYHQGSSPFHDEAIIVSSVDSIVYDDNGSYVDRISYFSNRGPGCDILAPGSDIIAATSNNTSHTLADYPDDSNYNITSISGTSMASPQVAGVAALHLQSKPNLTPVQVRDRLVSDAKNVLYDTGLDDDYIVDNGNPSDTGYGTGTYSRSLFAQPNKMLFSRYGVAEPVQLSGAITFANSSPLNLPLTPEATFSVTSSTSSVDEGNSFTITLATTNVSNGTNIPYTITGVSSADISNASLTGNFTVGTVDSITINVSADLATEGSETFNLALDNGEASVNVTINDTSVAPPSPTYTLSSNKANCDEGSSFIITLATTNVSNGTSVPYTITGVSSIDINNASLTGNFVVGTSDSITFNVTADTTTEGVETFNLALDNNEDSIGVTINDTSTAPVSAGNFDPTNAIVLTIDTQYNTNLTVGLTSTTNAGNDLVIDWGDGTIDQFTGNTSVLTQYGHNYGSTQTYTVKIYGNVKQFGSISSIYSSFTSARNITACTSFGNLTTLQSLSGAFRQCPNLTSVPSSLPSSVTDLSYMFYEDTNSFNDSNVINWDVSNVTDFSGCFYGYYAGAGQTGPSIFNQDISGWVVSSATSLKQMFADCGSFNQPIGSWNVSSVTDFSAMFAAATAFNQNLNSWNVTNATTLSTVFKDASAFNNGEALGSNTNPLTWSTPNVTSMYQMFRNCNFNQALPNFNTTNVTLMNYMFLLTNWNEGDISGWDVSNVTSFQSMFSRNETFNQNISSWNTSSATNMSGMFGDAYAFNQDLSGWNVTNVTNMSSMFRSFYGTSQYSMAFNNGATAGTSNSSGLSSWNTTNVTNMSSMFYNNGSFNSDISGWDVSSVTSFSSFFASSGSFTMSFNQNISTWNTASATNMSSMFKYCSNFNSDLSNWDVANVTNMDGMFLDCQSFTADLSGWCVTNIPSLPNAFYTTPLTFTLPVWGTCPP